MLSSEVNDIDLLIRTSGENRISNFLPIQLSYSELYFCDTLWPDFNNKDLLEAFEAFSKEKGDLAQLLKVTKNK